MAVVFFAAASAAAGAVRQAAPPSQHRITVSGTVSDAAGRPIDRATVSLGPASAESGADGSWRLLVEPGRHLLRVARPGYDAVERTLDVGAALGRVEVVLTLPIRLREALVVRAVRAEPQDPVTKSQLDRHQIEAVNRGQEMPFVIGSLPSITYQSDAGNDAGYAYFSIRGIGQTRLNVTLDGVPLQDPEDQALYFSNVGDLASVVESVQVQRGVGTSSVGSASYGGSVNFASVNPADVPAVEIQVGGGSWGTARGTAALHSGRLAGGLAFYGRVSAQTSDGFRDHAFARQQSGFYGLTRHTSQSSLKLFGFSGRTRTGLSYLATEEAVLADDLRHNDLSPEERDRFGQDVVHAHYTRLAGDSTTLMGQVYYNGAQGWFRIRDVARDRLQQYGLDGHAVGLVLGATSRRARLGVNWGAHLTHFTRDHFMDVVGGVRDYVNRGTKREASSFVKLSWTSGRAGVWGDLQVRHARFRYEGELPLGAVSWTFVNPKAGFRLDAGRGVTVYGSVGRLGREPTRSDLLAGEDNATVDYDLRGVKPERVVDVEGGVEVRRGPLGLHLTGYAMEFRDEIALTGELSAIGLPVRRNVGRSSRRGVEVEATWRLSPLLRVAGNVTVSRNRIVEWRQFYDVYDESGAWIDGVWGVHRDVPPLLSPALVLNGAVDWQASRVFDLGASLRWVGRSHLDNTGHDDFRTPSFLQVGLRASSRIGRERLRGDPRVVARIDNLLDHRQAWPGGYSYQYLSREASGREAMGGTAFYYPLATRSLHVALELRF